LSYKLKIMPASFPECRFSDIGEMILVLLLEHYFDDARKMTSVSLSQYRFCDAREMTHG
jgi:hypothetical protein